ncbi:MAG: hypothetical protein JRJ59_08125, partial [Deltaproteobacteria bacterium]|nr:hypothetical protein [Deltaproteobacteria bacterium]
MKFFGPVLGRVAVWALLVASVLAALSLFQPTFTRWSKRYGGLNIVSPPLHGGLFLGQPLSMEDNNLSQLGFIFATYTRQATGRVEVLVLKGKRPPQSEEEIQSRLMRRAIIEAGRLKDNDWQELSLWPPLINVGVGTDLYLLIRRSGDFEPSSLS